MKLPFKYKVFNYLILCILKHQKVHRKLNRVLINQLWFFWNLSFNTNWIVTQLIFKFKYFFKRQSGADLRNFLGGGGEGEFSINHQTFHPPPLMRFYVKGAGVEENLYKFCLNEYYNKKHFPPRPPSLQKSPFPPSLLRSAPEDNIKDLITLERDTHNSIKVEVLHQYYQYIIEHSWDSYLKKHKKHTYT